MSLAGPGAAGGALWGGLIGLLFLAPLLGMAIGARQRRGGRQDVGRRRRRPVHEDADREAAAGGAALIALGSTGGTGKVLERVSRFGGEVIQTSLSTEDEERLRAALGEAVAGA